MSALLVSTIFIGSCQSSSVSTVNPEKKQALTNNSSVSQISSGTISKSKKLGNSEYLDFGLKSTSMCYGSGSFTLSYLPPGCSVNYEYVENGVVTQTWAPTSVGSYSFPAFCSCGPVHAVNQITVSGSCGVPPGTYVQAEASVVIPCPGKDICDLQEANQMFPQDLQPMMSLLKDSSSRNFSTKSIESSGTVENSKGNIPHQQNYSAHVQSLMQLFNDYYDHEVVDLNTLRPQTLEEYKVLIDQLEHRFHYLAQKRNAYEYLFAGMAIMLEMQLYDMLLADINAGNLNYGSASDYPFVFNDIQNQPDAKQVLMDLQKRINLNIPELAKVNSDLEKDVESVLAESLSSGFKTKSVYSDIFENNFAQKDCSILSRSGYGPAEIEAGAPGASLGQGGFVGSGFSSGRGIAKTGPNGGFKSARLQNTPKPPNWVLYAELAVLVAKICASRQDFTTSTGSMKGTARDLLNKNLAKNEEECKPAEQAHHIMPLSGEGYKTKGEPRYPDIERLRSEVQSCIWEKADETGSSNEDLFKSLEDGINSHLNGVCLEKDPHDATKKDPYWKGMQCVIQNAINKAAPGQKCTRILRQLENIKTHLKANNKAGVSPDVINDFNQFDPDC